MMRTGHRGANCASRTRRCSRRSGLPPTTTAARAATPARAAACFTSCTTTACGARPRRTTTRAASAACCSRGSRRLRHVHRAVARPPVRRAAHPCRCAPVRVPRAGADVWRPPPRRTPRPAAAARSRRKSRGCSKGSCMSAERRGDGVPPPAKRSGAAANATVDAPTRAALLRKQPRGGAARDQLGRRDASRRQRGAPNARALPTRR